MEDNLFDINNFNIIQDDEYYYFFRALNMADNADIEQQTTISTNGKIERIRTDRERFDGETKYTEDSEISLEEIYDHIKMHYRKDTNCISLTSNANIAVNYGRGSYKDRYVMIKIPKKEFGERTVAAGQYMLRELYSRVEQTIENLPKENEKEILDLFAQIEDAKENKSLQDIIAQRYTAKSGELNPEKAHLRKGITYSSPKARISSYQSLDEEQLLEVNKVYAKLAILENEHILEHVIPHSSNSKLRETIGNAFSSAEVIHYGDIKQEYVLEIPKEVVDIFALVQQVNGIDKNKLEELKQALIIAVQSGKEIPQIPEIDSKVKDNISIEEMYELTEGKVEYGKANSIVRNMFYLSKSRQNAIALSNALSEILGNDSRFEDIIQYIRENGFRIEPEIISRKSGKGVKLSESVNLNLQKEEQSLVDKIRKLSPEELNIVLQNGGLYNAQDIITTTFSNIRENEKIDKSRYYAEAIIAQYNWQDIGIEEFKVSERNELIKRLQERNCAEIYDRLQQFGIEESQIPTILLNIATREGFYEQYVQSNLEQLLNTRQDVLQNNINIEVVERFLGYYDVENSEIRLKDYQQRAYDNINKIFEDKKFAQVILPTGAGKSFVALAQMQKYAQEHPNEKMLYLAPQDEILNQIKSYIVKYVHGKQGTVGKTEDEIIAKIFPNITFETYSGLLAKRGQEVIKDQYGMIVLDELHRTGAKEWEGKIDKLLENQTEDVKILGITATPTRDVDGRDMANETAKKLGYTDEEIDQRKHLASNMTLENAIRMGYVVNPKLVYCKYDLISSGKMDELRARIDSIEDESKRVEELQKYNELRQKLNREIDAEIGEEARKKLEEDARRNLDSGIGKEEILRSNVKKGGKYIVFIPVTDQGDIEDENGNRIGTKTGEDKIKAYQDYLNKVFEGTDIVPQLHSLLGSYSKDTNKEQLDAFESDNSEKTKFMVVMNKANEGLHIDGVDGIIWFRALDENSRILYLQQLGRAIYALDEDNPLPDDKRPVVIDLANNSLTVKVEKEFEDAEPIDDLEALTIVMEWIEQHDGMIPNRESSNKQEQHYYAVLRRIQNKYSKYLDGFDNFKDLTEEEKSRIQEIINLASEIDLWNIELPPIPKSRGNNEKINPFEITGVLRDYIEFEEEIDRIKGKNTVEEFIKKLKKMRLIGIDTSKLANRDTIKTLAEKSGISEEEILELGLNPNDNIGTSRQHLVTNFRKREEYVTKNQLQELLELGIDLIAKDITQEFINKLEKLHEIGVDISNIVYNDTIKSLAKKSDIGEEKILEMGLNPNDNIGNSKNNIAQNYRKDKEYVSDEQLKRLSELGISLEIINKPQEFINKLEKLQEIGVDVSKIKTNDTIKSLAKKSGVSEEQIKELGLKPNEKIGNKKSKMESSYKKNFQYLTQEQIKKLADMGILIRTTDRNIPQEFIEKLEKMQEAGVNVSQIVSKDTIKSLAQKSGVSEEQIKELGLEPNERIGNSRDTIGKTYRKDKRYVTKEQLERLNKLGISLELINRNIPQEFIDKLEKLHQIGVDVSKIVYNDTIKSLAKKSDIGEERLLEINLDPNDNIGNSKSNLAQNYRKDKEYVSDEQLKRLSELGISLELRNIPQEFIDKLEKLQEIGVDVSKIIWNDTIKSLAEKSNISENVVVENGLQLNDNIGNDKTEISQRFRKDSKYVTKEQLKILSKMGINLEYIERNVPQEFIDKLEKLHQIGVDVSKISNRDTIQTLAKKSGISEELIKNIGLEPNDKIGSARSVIAIRYRKNNKYVTEEQIKKILGFGIALNKKTRTGKEIVEASISSIKNIEIADNEDRVLKELVAKTKEGGINLDE